MPKFYISCAELREIVIADDLEQAALVAFERFFQPLAWIFQERSMTDQQRRAHLAVEALTRLEARVTISERGFLDVSGRTTHFDRPSPWHSNCSSAEHACQGSASIPTAESFPISGVNPQPSGIDAHVLDMADVLDCYFQWSSAASRPARPANPMGPHKQYNNSVSSRRTLHPNRISV